MKNIKYKRIKEYNVKNKQAINQINKNFLTY